METVTSEFVAHRWVLFQRDDCGLCDQALVLLATVRAPEFESVFIDGNDVLEARYGARVPVFKDEQGRGEMDWPFDAEQLRKMFAMGSHGGQTQHPAGDDH